MFTPDDPRSYTQRLIGVRAAIDDLIASGQSVTYNGRSLSLASLDSLIQLEKYYASQAASEQATCKGRNRILYVTPVT